MISKKITAAFIAAATALAPLFTCGQTALANDAADSSAAVSDSAAPASDIMRFTVYDADTGELIPDEILDKPNQSQYLKVFSFIHKCFIF